MRASVWGPVGVKMAAVAVALLVLGWIGRTAAAGPSAAPAFAADHGDASPPLPAAVMQAVIGLDAGVEPPAVGLPPPAPPPPQVAAGSRGRATATDPVFLNQASVDELRRLPGVGPKRAEAILVLRQRLGRFQRVEDLLRVKGVGRGAVKKWRPLVRLDAPEAGAP